MDRPRDPFEPSHPESFKSGVARFLESIERGARWFQEHVDEVTEFLEKAKARSEDQAWSYLLENVPGFTGTWVVLALEAGERLGHPMDDTIGQILDEGFCEPGFLEQIRSLLASAPISSERREQFEAGVDYIAARRHHLAVPMLINPLEGAFWRAAEQRELIEQDRDGKWVCTAKSGEAGKKIHSVEGLFWLEGLKVDDKFRGFLLGLAYGGGGDPYRHGTAEGGWRLRALCLLMSLVGWLEMNDLLNAREAVRDAFIRADDQRERSSHQ